MSCLPYLIICARYHGYHQGSHELYDFRLFLLVGFGRLLLAREFPAWLPCVGVGQGVTVLAVVDCCLRLELLAVRVLPIWDRQADHANRSKLVVALGNTCMIDLVRPCNMETKDTRQLKQARVNYLGCRLLLIPPPPPHTHTLTH